MSKFIKVISVLQQKGGVGKTTIAVHLATQIKELFPHLKIALADADPQRSATIWLRSGEQDSGVEVHQVANDIEGKYLKDELATIDADLVIVDLPPAIANISMRAALYSDLILVPVGASALDIEAARHAVEVCKEAIALDPSKRFLLVPNRVQMNTAAGRELRKVLSAWGPVSKATLCLRVAYADSVMLGVGINTFAPGSPAYQEIGFLAEEVVKMLKLR
ncbi:MAG: ParA family protein [Desulfuromonas sp.]|nr:ParA family protein [Desulfuromonas sp.]